MSRPTCEGCDQPAGTDHYLVTHHDGTRSECRYCAECAHLAEHDHNGTTASISRVVTCEHCDRPVRLVGNTWRHVTPDPACFYSREESA